MTVIQTRTTVIYQLFPRNHTEQGTLSEVKKDLERIRSLGVDYIYLLPIHPVGEKNRKGDLGSPYAIQDYYAINPELGTMQDYIDLVEAIHAHGMRVMMDIVINHTAPDHGYVTSHPEFYYRKADGAMGNKVGDWTDIVDLDYQSRALWDEMIQMLVYWAKLGVDGFRCDVASFVPLAFWQEAKKAVAEVNPDVIWLAESVHKEFLQYYRNEGYLAHSDSELFQVFDICYDYDIHKEFEQVLEHKISLAQYAYMLNLQESIYPKEYCKLRFLENHDQPRIMERLQSKNLAKHWIAFSYFEKGCAFLYAGQEGYAVHKPDLFTKDTIELPILNEDEESFFKQLSVIKKHPLVTAHTCYKVQAVSDAIMQVVYQTAEEVLTGYFLLQEGDARVETTMPDGVYQNELGKQKIEIINGQLILDKPVIFYRRCV